MKRLGRRFVAGSALAAVLLIVLAPAASAHPLGNFTTSTAAALRASATGIGVQYTIDAAEIPTVRAKSGIDRDGNGTQSSAELDRYAVSTCRAVAEQTDVRVDGRRVGLTAGDGGTAAFGAGAAGLQTMRVDCELSADVDLSADDHEVTLSNDWIGDRIGWHEITATGSGVTLAGSVPTTSASDQLRVYPEDLLSAPPDVRTATISTSPGGETSQGGATTASGGRRVQTGSISALPGVDSASRSFTDLVSKERLTVGIALTGLVLAILLGSLHALAPGHGKTVMAAYMLGGEGTGRQAMALCATVTVTHTAGVLVLGTALTVTTVIAPERLYPILGAISGLLVASIGVTMLRRARQARTTGFFGTTGHSHPHLDHDHPDHHDHDTAPDRELVAIGAQVVEHSHGPAPAPDDHSAHAHTHGHQAQQHEAHGHQAHGHSHPDLSQPVSWRSLVGMGFAGGMVPSPSALLVLLGAIALGRTWFGVALVIAYGIGMAVSLVAAGLFLLRIRNRLDRYLTTRNGQRASKRMAIMPVVTASFVVAGGLYVALRALLQL